MRRQAFITRRRLLTAISIGAFISPGPSSAQSKTWRVGYLATRSRSTASAPDIYYDAFVQGLRDLGYAEGRNLQIEWRFAEGHYERIPALAVELVKSNVDVLATHNTEAALALQQATRTIPIVFTGLTDPVGSGLVKSLAHPGGNVTGLSGMISDLSSKQVELLKSTVPGLARIVVLVNPVSSVHPKVFKNIEIAAQHLKLEVTRLEAATAADIERSLTSLAREKSQALIVPSDSFFLGQRVQISRLAIKGRLPAMFHTREFVAAGGLMSYGENAIDFFRREAVYVDKILKGAKPDELPIEQPSQIHFALNRKTAKAIGLTIPQELLLRADEVIE